MFNTFFLYRLTVIALGSVASLGPCEGPLCISEMKKKRVDIINLFAMVYLIDWFIIYWITFFLNYLTLILPTR